ncbi:uncharacterized protein [Nothobranchius furzeri]|uniref:uncharacterized protein n=1 Tax=Nothobranchius furzeri TaxID=105023 RepID=UPI0039046676
MDNAEGEEARSASEGGDSKDGAEIMRTPERGKVAKSPPVTLPRYDPESPEPRPGSGPVSPDHARLQVRLARLKYEAEDKQRRREFELRKLELELEADTRLKMRRMELEMQAERTVHGADAASRGSLAATERLDVGKCMGLMPPFREAEVDSYFAAFERIATTLSWPREVWPLLLQCKLSGKAQEVMTALSVSDCGDYDTIKDAVLHAYELVPEAYRQKFRSLRKRDEGQTFVEFAREKGLLFDKWLQSSKVTNLNELRELVLLEEFKRCLPERTVLYLNEQKVNNLSAAALLADEFMLTHRVKVEKVVRDRSHAVKPRHFERNSETSPPRCFYCHQVGHIVKDCLILKRRERKNDRVVAFVASDETQKRPGLLDPSYQPFILEGSISMGEG